MKTAVQKMKLLASEGWRAMSTVPVKWTDPRDPRGLLHTTAQAYAIAYRRMEWRETHALRSAGWAYEPGKGWWDTRRLMNSAYFTRSQAWASLYRK